MKKITSTDIARLAGCSQATVSKVINGKPNVSPEMREHVMKHIRNLDYKLKCKGELKRVVIILPSPQKFRLDGYVAALLNAIIYTLFLKKIRMEIIQEDDLDFLHSHLFDGAISISWEPELTTAWFEHFQLPLVRINVPPDPRIIENMLGYVNMDSERTVKQLMDRLYSLGHRKIFLLTPDAFEIEKRRTRYKTFYNYLKKHRISVPESRCIFNMRSCTPAENLISVKKAVSDGATAFILVDEGYAHESYKIIRNLNLSIPKKISVICWGNNNIFQFSETSITGVTIDYSALSENAVYLLEEILKNGKHKNIYIPFNIVERNSIAPVFRKRSKNKLHDDIINQLLKGPMLRKDLADVLGLQPYCGHFCRILKQMFIANTIEYHPESTGKSRLIRLNILSVADEQK